MVELNKIYNESNCETLERMPDGFLDCIVTSPPYWGLRDYGVEGQLGLERTVEEYILKLVSIFDLCMAKLKTTGTCWVNLGDTYISEGGASRHKGYADPKYSNGRNGEHIEPHAFPQTFLPKSLANVPNQFSIEMCRRGWILRNEIIWWKPNAMPQSAKDRFTVDYEKLFFFTKDKKYYFKQILEPYKKALDRWGGTMVRGDYQTKTEQFAVGERAGRNMRPNPEGRNMRSVWRINTEATAEAHFATYPEDLVSPCIISGCPENGIVYDPFMGSGTTARVAAKLSRNYVGSEINPDYLTIAERKVKTITDQYKMFDIQAKNTA